MVTEREHKEESGERNMQLPPEAEGLDAEIEALLIKNAFTLSQLKSELRYSRYLFLIQETLTLWTLLILQELYKI